MLLALEVEGRTGVVLWADLKWLKIKQFSNLMQVNTIALGLTSVTSEPITKPNDLMI